LLPVDRANAQNASDYPGSECAHATHDHLVQFYEADHHLIESAGGFIASGLAAGETVLVVVTDSHKKELITNLEGHGLEIDSPTLPGRFVCLDVERVQADLTVNGDFSGELFTSFATALLEQAVATRRPFRVFGELVALYWAEGKYATAIEIEKRWDDLVKSIGSHCIVLILAVFWREKNSSNRLKKFARFIRASFQLKVIRALPQPTTSLVKSRYYNKRH